MKIVRGNWRLYLLEIKLLVVIECLQLSLTPTGLLLNWRHVFLLKTVHKIIEYIILIYFLL